MALTLCESTAKISKVKTNKNQQASLLIKTK